MAKGNYTQWSSDHEKNPLADTLLQMFLDNPDMIKNPPNVRQLCEKDDEFSKFNPNSLKNHIRAFANKAETVLLRRQAEGKLHRLT